MSIIHLSALIRKEDGIFTSWCPEIDVTSQGNTEESAIENLREAVELCFKNEQVRTKILSEIRNFGKVCPQYSCMEFKVSEEFKKLLLG